MGSMERCVQLLRQIVEQVPDVDASGETGSSGNSGGWRPHDLDRVVGLASDAASALQMAVSSSGNSNTGDHPALQTEVAEGAVSNGQGGASTSGGSLLLEHPGHAQRQRGRQPGSCGSCMADPGLLTSAADRLAGMLLLPPPWVPRPALSMLVPGDQPGTSVPEPEALTQQKRAASQQYLSSAATALHALADMVAWLPLPALHDGVRVLPTQSPHSTSHSHSDPSQPHAGVSSQQGRGEDEGPPRQAAGKASGKATGARTVAGGVVIEELGEGEGREEREEEEQRQAALACAQRLLLLSATFFPDPHLPSPWQQWCTGLAGAPQPGSQAGPNLGYRAGGQGGGEGEGEGAQGDPVGVALAAAGAAAQRLVMALADATCTQPPLPPPVAGPAAPVPPPEGTATAVAGGEGAIPATAVMRAVATPAAAAAASTGYLSLVPAAEARRQCLLASLLPSLLPQLRRALVSAQPQPEATPARSTSNGGSGGKGGREGEVRVAARVGLALGRGEGVAGATEERVVTARRMAWLVRATRHPFIGELVPLLIPAILAILDDPSAAVSVHGAWALHHLATEALPADLLWQRDLLLDTAVRLVVGCEEAMWEAVLPSSIATVRALEGRDPRAPGYHTLLSEILTEAERNMHKRCRRLPFLQQLGPLVEAMGLAATRHLSRLMPLVLECLHAYDPHSRAVASRLLLLLVRCTWQRQAAHAPLLWRHLVSAYARDAQGTSEPSPTNDHQRAEDPLQQPAHENGGCKAAPITSQPASSGVDGGGAKGEGEGEGEGDLGREVVRNLLALCRLLAGPCSTAELWQAVGDTMTGEEGEQGEGGEGLGRLVAFMQGLQGNAGGV